METLRFLMISTHFPPYQMGGDAIMAGHLANELSRRGHEVHALFNPNVYRLIRGDPELSGSEESKTDSIVRHGYESVTGRLDPVLSLSIGYWRRTRSFTEALCREIKPDVVHWHNSKGFIGIPFETPGAISFYTAHDYYSICPRSNLLRPGGLICEKPRFCQTCLIRWRKIPQVSRIGNRFALKLPANICIISPSEFMARKLSAFGMNADTIIRNFVPDPGIPRFENHPNSRSLVYLGLLEPHKGTETLLDAFIASSRKHAFVLYIIGEGSLRTSLARKVVKYGLSERVFVTGYLSQSKLANILADATALVIPSEWYENAPLVALEALAKGIVIVGSDIGGLPEILKPDSGALLFRAGDSEDLSEALIRLWRERDCLDWKRLQARRAYETRFTPAIHMRQYLNKIRMTQTGT